MNLLLEKVPSLRHIKHSPTFFHRTWSGVIFLSGWLNVCVKSWRFPSSVSLSSLLVAIKTMRVPRQYWEKRTVTDSEQGNSLFSLFPFLKKIFKTRPEKKKEPYFYEITSFTPNGHLLGGFFFFSCGQFDRWSTSWFCWSLLVLWGLQVKPPCSPERTKQNKSHAQELAK